MKKTYLNKEFRSREFLKKNSSQQKIINEALEVVSSLGIPFRKLTPRRLEKTALAFLAVLDVKDSSRWKKARDVSSEHSMKTRDIIGWINKHFGETISMGSYDDIRRKDLKMLVLADIVVSTHPDAATNDSRRGYALNPTYTKAIRSYGSSEWGKELSRVKRSTVQLNKILERKRELSKIPVTLPTGVNLQLTKGKHNDLQKAIIEGFLPIYGYEPELLYVGDTANKLLYLDEAGLKKLSFFELNHDKLPDVISYSRKKNWLYLIEAVYSSGPMSETRVYELKKLTKGCTADIIYVTAFLDRQTFRKFMSDIAWETEVWIADNPEHLIHFNGHNFLGPYKK